jgi:hypothetical protein
MPNKKVTLTAFAKMESRVEALEGGLNEVRTTLQDVQTTMHENQASIVALLEKYLGKSIRTDGESENSAIPVVVIPEKKSEETPGSSRNDTTLEFRQTAKKVELPSFDGEDPAGWISRAEVYFKVQGTTPEMKVSLSQLCMDGPTIHFFNSMLRENEDLTWDELKEALLERYGGHGEGDVYEQLTDLKQDGTIEEYITEFEYLVAQIPKLPEKQFRSYFLHGLKTEIRGRLRSLVALGEMNRTKLFQVARTVEREFGGGSGSNRGPRSGNGPNRSGSHGLGRKGSDWVMVRSREGSSSSSGGVKSYADGPRGDRNNQGDRKRTGPRDRGFTQLSYNELMECKQKGLCFKCKQPMQTAFWANASMPSKTFKGDDSR